jgi:Flp pilus assembly protein TadG
MRLKSGLRKPAVPARVVARLFEFCGEEGTELMEFAFVFPALMAILTLVASGAMGFYNYQQLANATATATQNVANDAGIATDPCAYAVTQLTSAWQVKNWTAANFSYRIAITSDVGQSGASTYYYPSSTGTSSGSAFSCTPGAAYLSGQPPVAVVLTVSYSYNWFPIFHSHNDTGTMSATTGSLTVSQGVVTE